MHEWACCRDEAANHQLPIAVAFWVIQTVSIEECSSFTKFDADPLFYSFSHFEWDGHTVHTLTQWCLPPPLTSTVKSLLFTYMHSSPLSLDARLHGCRTNCSFYINNGWTFSGQPSYILSYTVGWEQKFFVYTQYILNKLKQVDIMVGAAAHTFKMPFIKSLSNYSPRKFSFFCCCSCSGHCIIFWFSFALAMLSFLDWETLFSIFAKYRI